MPYLNTDEIQSALTALSTAYPGTCELITLPNLTHEGRTVRAIRIAQGALDNRPAMAFVGGQHAREWGSGDICISLATDLLEAYATNSGLTYGGQSFSSGTVKRILEDGQVFVFPTVNPDGRHYSQTVDPDWRKNRNPVNAVDPNRNFDVLWDFNTALHPAAGAVVSDVPSSDTYHGPAPFSEPETQNVKWLFDTFPQIRWAVDIHSYSELLYHVWGHDQNQITTPSQNFTNAAFDGDRGLEDDAYSEYIPSGDLGTQCGLVERMQTALQAVRGITYQTGQSFELYPTTGTLTDYPYSRHIADPTQAKVHGFLIEWGTEFQPPSAEMDNIILDISSALVAFADQALDECGILDISLETPTLMFNDVPAGETTYRAVTFRVTACCTVDFEIIDGPDFVSGAAGTSFDTPLGATASAGPAPNSFTLANLWVSYTGTSVGDTAVGTITVRCRQTNQTWQIDITTNVIARPTAAVMLVFDQSGSMLNDSGLGSGVSRGDVLEFSAPPVVSIIEDDNALGIMSFDHDPHPAMPITDIDAGARMTANGHIAGYMPNVNGNTSIGEAVAEARDQLDDPGITQDVKAMIVLTDGREDHGTHDRRYISEVSGLIDNQVFAIGLGTPGALEPAALRALCDNQDGYMLLTGALNTGAEFKLTKYYQQILAGVTNNEIVVDPEGSILPGQRHVIPFRLSETDISADAILLSPAPWIFKYTIIAPSGEVIDTGTPAANPAVETGGGNRVRYYRMTLPLVLGGPENREGTWQAVLEVDRKLFKRYLAGLKDQQELIEQTKAHGARYSVMCRTWSNLRFHAGTSQDSNEPGANLTLHGRLLEFGVPVEGRAAVTSEVVAPNGSESLLNLVETGPGTFEADMVLNQTGLYSFRVLAKGQTFRGTPFTRERTLTAAVWNGGDRPPPGRDTNGDGSGHDGDDSGVDLCCLLECFLKTDSGQRFLKKHEIDPNEIAKCLEKCCRKGDRQAIGVSIPKVLFDQLIALAK